MPEPAAPPRSALDRLAPPLLLALMAALLVLSSFHKRLSYDEFDNLAYGHRFLVKGPSTWPQGQRMPILAANAFGCLTIGCRQDDVNATETRRLFVRLPTMAFTLLLGVLVHRWAKELFGPPAGRAALVLYATNPSFLAHGKQVTSDVQTALFTFAAFYFLWRVSRESSRKHFVLCVLATTAALASKFTSLLILPVMAALVGIHAIQTRHQAGAPSRMVRRSLLFAVLVLLSLNAVYLFDGSFEMSNWMPWQSRAFRRLADMPLPVPLPRVYALGLDYSSYLQENPEVARGQNYVLGELNRDGRWYAFPLMLLLKTPLAFFVLLVLAARHRRDAPREAWTLLIVPPLAILGFFSFLVDPQLGIRYILPALPFLIVAAGAGALGIRPWIAAGLLVWHAASTMSYHPHYMAYFNELIGRRVNAYRYLADSNLDWEDHAYFIARFQERHPELQVTLEPAAPQPGHILVGANQLVGIFDEERYRWLRENFTPVGHVAYSHLLFQVTPQRLQEILAKGAARGAAGPGTPSPGPTPRPPG